MELALNNIGNILTVAASLVAWVGKFSSDRGSDARSSDSCQVRGLILAHSISFWKPFSLCFWLFRATFCDFLAFCEVLRKCISWSSQIWFFLRFEFWYFLETQSLYKKRKLSSPVTKAYLTRGEVKKFVSKVDFIFIIKQGYCNWVQNFFP